MRQIVTLAILAAVAVAGWTFRDKIKGLFKGEEVKQQAQGPATPGPNPTLPNSTSTTSPVSTPGVGTNTSATTTPATRTPTTTTEPATAKTTTPPTEPEEKTPKVKMAPSVPDEPEVKPLKVEITLEMERDPATDAVTFYGATNLPVGTLITFSFAGRSGIVHSSSFSIVGGSPRNRFQAGPYSLTDTTYRIEILAQRQRQSAAAAARLFDGKSEMLQGPLVENVPNGRQVHTIGTFLTRSIAKAKARVGIAMKPPGK